MGSNFWGLTRCKTVLSSRQVVLIRTISSTEKEVVGLIQGNRAKVGINLYNKGKNRRGAECQGAPNLKEHALSAMT